MNSGNTNDTALTRTILVTDSGLGGLSVFNDIANRLENNSPWQKVKLVYFNAWPAPHRGYNHFDTLRKRVRIFNNALNAMDEYQPDLILIACNTLSVIYPHTRFCKSSSTMVDGIVDHGVNMMVEKLKADPKSVAVIFGTPTTIDAKSHEAELIRQGIEKDRIINIRCTNLAGWIERQPFSETVGQMINTFVEQAGTRLGRFAGNVYAALCCTHFGYRQSLFEEAFTRIITGKVTILNPNIQMAQQMFEPFDQAGSFSAKIKMRIVSKAVWEDDLLDAYEKLLTPISPSARDALRQYTLDDHLFSVE